MVFPAQVEHLMPLWEDIPEQYRRGHTKANQFFQAIFIGGAQNTQLIPKEGIDPKKAWRHLTCICRSYQPKHEHKEAAFAYLVDTWFDEFNWEMPTGA